MVNITHSRIFQKVALKSFAECDKDANGKLDEKELHICLLLLYDKLNKKLPCHLNVPTAERVRELFQEYDVDGDGGLSEEQFLEAAAGMLVTNKQWWNTVVARATFKVAITLVVFPLAGRGLAHLLRSSDVPLVRRSSPEVCAYGTETAYKALKIGLPELP